MGILRNLKMPQHVTYQKTPRKQLQPKDIDARPYMERLKYEPLPEPVPYRGEIMRDSKGRLLPGSSGMNPLGAQVHVMNMLRALTADGEELIAHALHVMRGDMTAIAYTKSGEPYECKPTLSDQAEARRFLSDRLLGKAPETIKHVEDKQGPSINYDALDEAELLTLRKLLIKAAPVESKEAIDVTPVAGKTTKGE